MTEFVAEPLRSENSWRVRRTFDGQNVLFRVSREEAEAFIAALKGPQGAGGLRMTNIILFCWTFWAALHCHRKRGNRAIKPLGIIKSFRMAQCERYIRRGSQERHIPWFMRRNNHD